MEEHKPVIEFQSYRLTNIDFSVYDDLEEINALDLEEGSIRASLNADDDFRHARLKISTTIVDSDNLRTIDVEITGFFNVNESDNNKAENYMRVNGTAILLPYLRAIVSILSSLDNENSIIMPTFNTNSLVKLDD